MQSTTPGRHGLGIAFYLVGVFLFAANDALGKWLVADYAVSQLLLVRSVGGIAMLLLFARIAGHRLALNGQWPLQGARILFLTGDTFSFYYATRALPLADVMTFYMAAPLIVTALSGPLLGEKVGPYRWGAVIVGFIGVLIALAPTGAAFQPSALIALFGATMFALSLTVTRKLRDSHWLPLVTWQFIGAGLVGAAASPFVWVTPDTIDTGLMLVVGFVSAICFVCITRALALAPTSLLAPFQYSAIVWAGILGWIIWHDAPTPRILLGNGIIIASGLFVLYRERRKHVSVGDRVEPIP
jgi:S-adenosylmethionine uptake transporter